MRLECKNHDEMRLYELAVYPNPCSSQIAQSIIIQSHVARRCSRLPLLHQQQMHSKIGKHNECTTIYGQPNTILPQRLHVEAKAAENRRARDLNVQTVFVVNEREVLDFIDNEAFKGIVKYR
jgi:hypothetical protein